MLKKIAGALFIISASFISSALAQQGIQLAPGQVLGNPTASQRPSLATGLSPLLDRSFGSTQGTVLNRGATVWGATSNVTLGTPGSTQGTLAVSGATSGQIVIQPQSVAGAYNFNLPTAAGAVGQPMLSGGGGASPMTFGTLSAIYGGTGQTSYTLGDILFGASSTTLSKLGGNTTAAKQYLSQTGTGSASAAPVWASIDGGDITGHALTAANDTNVTLTLGGSPATSLLRSASVTAGWTGTLAVGRGGTGLSVGQSGGIPYFSSTSTMASSAPLTANALVLGGGAGQPPVAAASLGTSTQVLHGNASGAPSFGPVVGADISTNTVSNTNLGQGGAATFKGNPTAALANIQDFTIQGLANLASPSNTLDLVPIYDHTTGTIKNATPQAIANSIVTGVTSFNSRTGGVVPVTGDYSAAMVPYTAPGTGGTSQPTSTRLAREIWANDYGAACNGSTPDDTAFLNAYNAAVASGAKLRFVGTCVLNNTFNITNALVLQGNSPETSTLQVAPANNGIFINTAQRVILKDFTMVYSGAGGNPGTYGILKSTPGSAQSVGDRYENLQIFGASTVANIDKANIWIMKDCLFSVATNGIFINNSFNFDNGDMLLVGNTFTAMTSNPITYFGGGGLRLLSNKFSGTFVHGVEMNLGGAGTPSTTTTSDLIAVGNSIESSTASSIGFYFHRSLSTVFFLNVVLSGNQFLTNTTVYVPTDATGNWLTNMTIVGNTWLAAGNPGGAEYSIDSVSGLDISGGSSQSAGTVNSTYFFGANVTGKMSMPSRTGTFNATNTNNSPGMTIMNSAGTAFANIPPTAANGSQIFITDGATGTLPCTGGGTGATAVRQAGAWKCL